MSTARAARVHADMPQFEVRDNALVVGGRTLPELAAEIGRTPFYAYDRELLTRRVAELRAAMPKGLSLHYAMKANPMPAVVEHMSTLVEGLDVASGLELKVAAATQTPRHDISFAGPGKTDAELSDAVDAGIVIIVESEGELARLRAIAKAAGKSANIAVRVNPDFELKASGMRMTGGAKPFGIDAERVPQVLSSLVGDEVSFHGLHIYTGSQNLKAERVIEAHENVFALAYELSQYAPTPVRLLNIGGGLGIPYFPGDERIELAPIAERLEHHLAEAATRLPDAEVVMELGRYLVGEAGLYVAKVIDRKVSRGVTYLITDGGLHHHLALSGNFGQVVRKNYPVAVGNRVSSDQTEVVNVVGPLCTPLDILADKMELPAADVGDLIAVYQSGAYGLTASPRGFLSHPEPAEVLV